MFKQDPTCSVGLPWQSGTLRTSDWYWARPDPLPFGAPSPPVGGWPRCGLRVSLRGLHVGRGRRLHRRQSARFRRRSKLCVEARLKTLKRKVHPNEIFFSWHSNKSSIYCIGDFKTAAEERLWPRVSVQGVKSHGGHFASLCREFDFYEVEKNILLFFKKKREILLHV